MDKEGNRMIDNMLKFLDNSPTAYNATKNIADILSEKGYEELFENKEYKVKKGGKYFIRRNGSSIIAFNIGKKLNNPALHLTSSHTDCPSYKVKSNALLKTSNGVKLNVEKYGGVLHRPWFDRPLSLAGRVMINKGKHVEAVTYLDTKPFCILASVPPHLSREVENKAIDPEIDMVPIVSLNDKYDFNDYLARNLKINKKDILGYDLFVYPIEKAYKWGDHDEFITSKHLDNLECAYTSLMGFINTFNDNNINVFASYDNEEISSLTRQGANSDFLELNIQRITKELGVNYGRLVANGFQLSCDNAHGIHPNHPELYDKENAPKLNGGVVIKFAANQTYTSDGLSGALFRKLLSNNNIKYQEYANRTGIRGGRTLGNFSNSHVSLISIDIGLAQWAMHSPIETCGSEDVNEMIKAIKCFYKTSLNISGDCFSL